MSKRIPAALPFVLRYSLVKLARLLLVAAVLIELVLLLVTEMEDPADGLDPWWTQAIVAGLLVLSWLLLASRRPIFGLDTSGVWLLLRGRPRPLALFVPWSQVRRIEQVRYQWQTSLGVTLRDPSVLDRDQLRGAATRRQRKVIASATEEAGKNVPRADLTVSLTLADTSVASVAEALRRLVPSDVSWHLDVPSAPGQPSRTAAAWTGRIVLGVGWILLFFAGVSWLAWLLFDVGLDSVTGKILAFASAAVGATTLNWAYTTYERLIAGRPTSPRRTDDRAGKG